LKKSFIKKVITLFAYIRDSLHNYVHLENMCIINHFHATQQFLISKVVQKGHTAVLTPRTLYIKQNKCASFS